LLKRPFILYLRSEAISPPIFAISFSSNTVILWS
jgi:hypothetical protein